MSNRQPAFAARRGSRVALVSGSLVGALLGGLLAWYRGAPFVVPDPIDATRWNVLVPGLDENVWYQQGRGSKVVGGEIVLTPHVFYRSDVMLPRDSRAIGGLTIELAPGSGAVNVRLRSTTTMLELYVRPDAWRVLPGGWTPHEGPVELQVKGGQVRIGDTVLGPLTPPNLELTASRELVRIRGITLVDEAGTPFVVEDPGATWAARAPIGWGLAAGALAGAVVAGVGVAGLGGGLLSVVLLLAVVLAPVTLWLALVERLYLVRMTPWGLARGALIVAFLPLLVQLLARSGLAVPDERASLKDPRAVLAWVGVATLVAALASRVASVAVEGAPGWMFAPIGLGLLLTPLLFARAARLDSLGLLVRDAPAAIAVALFGWGVGLFGALVWRLMLLVAGAGVLLRRAPRVAADAVFVSAILLVPAAELAVRSTWLDTAWDAARLGGDQSWRSPKPFWQEGCGSEPRASVSFMGGSSTGGAYQFRNEPGAFYPAGVHRLLCAAGLGVRSANYGHGGRDSFTVARSLPTILADQSLAIVVTYLGVNDLLTQESPLTRKEREAVEDGRSAATRGLASLGARSRILTGVGLLTRPGLDPDAVAVSDVPLADAEENLRRVAAATIAAGTWLVLVPEFTELETRRRMAGYAKMEARLAAELPGVVYVDPVAGLAPYAAEGLLIDRNHLSRKGSERLAEVLAPVLAGLLEAGPPPSAVSLGHP